MAKNKIITSQGNVQFINSKGRTIDMHPMHCYAIYENDTVSFLFIYMKEYSGQAFFASQYEDLELNGETYDSLDELKDAINYEFAKAGAQARTEIVTELPEDPFTNTIYLLPKEHGQGYDEYIWNEDEGWQLIGDTDIEFERYLKIEDFNPYSADTKDYIDAVSGNTVQNASDIVSLSGVIDTEISARTDADTALSGAIDSVASDLADEVSARTQADTTLQNNITSVNNRVDAEQIARANADTAISGAVDSVSGAVSTLSGEVQTMGDEAIVDAEYVSSSTTIDFYNASGAVVSQIDATPFITDGMIDDVRIETISGVTYLVIDFNTASGKEDIKIPLSDIFDPDNYYDKTATDALLAEKADLSALTEDERVWGEALNDLNSRINTVSGNVANKVDTSVYNTYTANTQTAINAKANSADVYTKSEVYTKGEVDQAIAGIDLSEYYTSAQTDSKIAEAVSGKANTLSAGTGISVTTGTTADTISLNVPIWRGIKNGIIEGYEQNFADGDYSHAEGQSTKANGEYSHAEGYQTSATSDSSHAEGIYTTASRYASHAEGQHTKASGNSSHAEGTRTLASGDYSHTEGIYTTANNQSEHASGQYNVSNSASTEFGDSGNTLFSVGNGTYGNNHNAFEIRQNGDIYINYDSADIILQDKLGEIEEVTASGLNALNDKFGGLKLMKITQAAYDALTVKDPNTLYIIID